MFITLAAALLMLSAAPLQTHQCDASVPTTFREPSAQLANLRLGFCFSPQDENGQPIEGPISFTAQIGNNPPIDLGQLTPAGPPNATGYSYYETTVTGLAAGTIHMNAISPTLGESTDSSVITLTLLGPPKAPKDPRIVRGPQE